ncbi:RNaseH domain-containing protein [Pseudomonas fragariae (ex Marin et al. 2024)]|uniref:RNaseH domain-containing protein n=1 Tax=Pseudomonas TaxID=286 RepID=UPI0004452E84|nr:RNaseH domain-containing protein [Pseudomonas syringae]AKF46153.1 hypothetical protein PsyrB_13345 [Pseudomonas syringae pv. syringae B301D]EXL31134.1 hypothetical protein PssB301D_02625 [Pseudomonas syringae pv. syringae str. B301D-R]
MDKHAPEHLLRLLAQGASLCGTDRAEAFTVLQRASALLWRLEQCVPPMSAIKLENQLSLPLEKWLPDALRLDYSGPLLYSNIATQTCNEMLLELDVSQLWEEVQASVNRVKQACRLRAEGEIHYRNFRLFLIEHGVIFPSEAQDVFIPLNLSLNEFYDPIPLHLYHNGLVYLCPECRWPMNAQRHEVSCDSAWCQDKKSLFVREGTSLLNRVNNSVLHGQPVDGRLMLKPALWKFTLQPGLIEIALASTLAGKGDPWQQLGVTEIAIIQPGAFDGAAAVAEQVALLCRNPPLWDGHLRLPGPMHLGKQVAADHPVMEARRKTEANRSAG